MAMRYERGQIMEEIDEDMKELLDMKSTYDQAGRLIFTGFRQDVSDILSETDILVVTSRNEALPRVVLEAASTGIPVVSTEVEGIHELIINKKSGYIVPQKDLKNIIRHVSFLIKNPEESNSLW